MVIIVVYAPMSKSTEKEIDKFHNTLENVKYLSKFQDIIIIILRDLNAKVEKEQDNEMICKYGHRSHEHNGKWF